MRPCHLRLISRPRADPRAGPGRCSIGGARAPTRLNAQTGRRLDARRTPGDARRPESGRTGRCEHRSLVNSPIIPAARLGIVYARAPGVLQAGVGHASREFTGAGPQFAARTAGRAGVDSGRRQWRRGPGAAGGERRFQGTHAAATPGGRGCAGHRRAGGCRAGRTRAWSGAAPPRSHSAGVWAARCLGRQRVRRRAREGRGRADRR